MYIFESCHVTSVSNAGCVNGTLELKVYLVIPVK